MRLSIPALACLYLTAGCAPASAPTCAACARARLANQWCEACKVGYVAGVAIRSKLLFEGLDAHGHDLLLSTIKCPDCRSKIEHEGFCEKCRIGWVRRQAYFSRLTYHLARGTPRDPDAITCQACRDNARRVGWCDMCDRGMIGNVEIRARSDYEGALRGYNLMIASIQASTHCENCALCILTDTSCFFCKIAWKDGHPVRPDAALTSANRPAR